MAKLSIAQEGQSEEANVLLQEISELHVTRMIDRNVSQPHVIAFLQLLTWRVW